MAQLSGAVQAADVIHGSADLDRFKSLLTTRVLVLAPHMDDETLACGGTMLLHAQEHYSDERVIAACRHVLAAVCGP